MIDTLLDRKSRKVKVLEMQKLCGYLNFLCRCIVPGRVFVKRLYICGSQLKPHHHVKLTAENRMDLQIWKIFLMHPEAVSRPFMDFRNITAPDIDMYSDASRNFELGFGAYCGTEWTYGQWDRTFMEKYEPSIEYLELFAVTVAVLNWIKIFKNKRITLFCDNEAVVNMINKTSSKCKHCMVLLRMLVLEGLIQNVRINARHVGTKENGKADALSRLDFKRFWKLAPYMNDVPTPIPIDIWPLDKIWMK